MIDVKRLALLREVALSGSLTGAGRALGLSSSAISQQLTRLERDTGVVLLEPAGRGVQLTLIASQLVQHAERIIEELEATDATLVAGRDGHTEVVRIAGFNTFATEMLPTLIHRLEVSNPELTIEFVQLDPEEAMDELVARRADLILADEYPNHPLRPGRGLIRTVVAAEPIQAFYPAGHGATLEAAEDSAEDTPFDLDALAQLSWVMEPRGTEAHFWARNNCRTLGFEPQVRYEAPTLQVHLQLVQSGLAAAFLPTYLAADSVPPLQAIPNFPSGLHRTVHTVIRRGTEHRPGVAVCVQEIDYLYRRDR